MRSARGTLKGSIATFVSRKKVIQKIVLVGLVFLLLPVLSARAFAQQAPLDVTVSPVYLDLSANPGSTLSEKFRIRNNSSSAINLQISVDKIVAKNNSVAPVKGTSQDTFLSWIKFDSNQVTAKPKEWTDVPFTIDIPKDGAFGYYYAIHVSQTASNTPINQPEAKLTGEVIIPVLLTVKAPGTKAEAKLVNFNTDSFVNEYLPVNFSVQIENTGNVHVAPRGNIFIRSGGKDITVLDVNDAGGNILPDGTRTYTASWDDGFMVQKPVVDKNGTPVLDKNGKPETQLIFNWNKLTNLRIGKYSANLVLVYDNGTRDVTIESSTTFWVLPYKIIGGTLLGIIILFFIFRLLLGRYIAAQVKKASKQ